MCYVVRAIERLCKLRTTSIRPPGAAAYVYNLHILRTRVKFLVDIIARRKVRVEFRLSQVHFRVPVVPLFLHQNTIIYPGKCEPFGNLGGCVRTRRTPPAYGPAVISHAIHVHQSKTFIDKSQQQKLYLRLEIVEMSWRVPTVYRGGGLT